MFVCVADKVQASNTKIFHVFIYFNKQINVLWFKIAQSSSLVTIVFPINFLTFYTDLLQIT